MKLVISKDIYRSCCPSWVKKSVWVPKGQNDDPWDVWNHPAYQKLRQDMLNHEHVLCKNNCPLIGMNFQQHDWHKTIMECGPQELVFATDPTCNLHCWMCRKKPFVDKDACKEEIWKFIRAFPDVRRYVFASSGDPFASSVYRSVLQEMDVSGNIGLLTNGLLLPRYWDSLYKIHGNIDAISISIDAATKETYERMRLGGKWEDLQKALALVKNLPLKNLSFNFVICRTNFKEMVTFARMAKEFGAHAMFSPIRDWRVSETFVEEDISNPTHPDHNRLLEVKQELIDYENHIRIPRLL